jgi:sodium transport system permease protein
MMKEIGATGIRFEPMAVLVSALSMLPVAALFAAALLAISIFARTYKEAQSYTGPLQIAVIIPALVSFMPGIELTRSLALVPLVNVSLVLKEAWSGIFQWDCIAILLVSSAAYAAIMLAFCVRWFQREEVLFRT